MPWTHNERKWLRELQHRKGREKHGALLVEGRKAIAEFLASGWRPLLLATTGESLGPDCLSVTARDLREVSSLDTPPDALAVFAWADLDPRPEGKVLVLDRVQDPGNAGTLLRMADWFGVAYVLHTTGTVDFGNPKTVQASMGSLARVPVRYASEDEAISLLQSEGRPIVVADLDGTPPSRVNWSPNVALVVSNEGQGPSRAWLDAATSVATIERSAHSRTESLNVATAAAMLLYEAHRGN
jgi:TrmH family RNA methyltransferase